MVISQPTFRHFSAPCRQNIHARINGSLAGIIATQIANVFACRSASISIFALGLFSNRLVLVGIASELLLAAFIIYTPLGNSLFASAPISAYVWLLLIPFAVLLLVFDETRKYFARRASS